jgi:ribosomal protein S18 acetylase RimI-like enzyme
MEILRATRNDLPEILDLQKSAYWSEAKLLNDYSIQPLAQTMEELEKEFSKSLILKGVDENRGEIIGSVRAFEEGGRVHIGKLMVRPDHQNKGLGTKLLKAMESCFEDKTFELYTSSRSEKNLMLYKSNGYKEFKRKKVSANFDLVYLEKMTP